jgi:nucleotide-binding universal stress UspA family protein
MTSQNGRRPFRRILLAYDGTPQDLKALEQARSLARILQSKLFIIGVDELPTENSAEALRDTLEAVRNRYQRVFYEIRLEGMNEGMQVDTAMSLGKPAEDIIRWAERMHVSLIVIGLQQTNPQAERCINALAQCVLRQSSCSVMVVT